MKGYCDSKGIAAPAEEVEVSRAALSREIGKLRGLMLSIHTDDALPPHEKPSLFEHIGGLSLNLKRMLRRASF